MALVLKSDVRSLRIKYFLIKMHLEQNCSNYGTEIGRQSGFLKAFNVKATARITPTKKKHYLLISHLKMKVTLI